MDYQYPILFDWTTLETIDVIEFYTSIEKAYEKGIKKEELMIAYKKFKSIVPSKADENKLCREFEELSGYSAYRTIQKGKELLETDIVKM
ncbi:UPF0223 family protein [Bacillus sp. RG28]|uniref:UPF0223 protein J5Y03_06095 n=1 Tax=Gottfriedia endophytica TaxID=2820819 RepID=A0A940SJC6_9BACI|nr:UPF0223 family protein [Gottfriedia endophytica]MBP0724759.1 UPF0223 family protein [Gottfriedia endophytica]